MDNTITINTNPTQAIPEDHSDMIIGAYDRYNWDKIKYWVNSIDRCGFNGRKVMIVMNSDKETVDKLISKGWKIAHFGTRGPNGEFLGENAEIPVHVLRFFYISYLLEALPEQQKPRNVITTDVRDVIFQKDPFPELEKYIGGGSNNLVVSSESIIYKNEPWGNQNLMDCFGPFLYEKYKDKEIYNVGVLAGTSQAIQELSQMIFEMAFARKAKIVDQAVFNFIIHQQMMQSKTVFTKSEYGWACQLGTTADPTKAAQFKPFLLEPSPKIYIREGGGEKEEYIATERGIKYNIVHQYDRVPEMKELLEKKYDDRSTEAKA